MKIKSKQRGNQLKLNKGQDNLHKQENNNLYQVQQPESIQQTLSNPQLATPKTILHLQRTIGNQAVQRLLSRKTGQHPTIQRGVKELIAQNEKAQSDSSQDNISVQNPRTQGNVSNLVTDNEQAQNDSNLSAPSKEAIVLAGTGLAQKQELFNAAIEQHQADRAALLKHVERGVALGREQKIGRGKMSGNAQKRLANSCEWILEGKTKLYALTPTGDSSDRVTADGKNPADESAFFPRGMDDSGTGDIISSIAPYNPRDLTDNTNVEIDTNTTVGWNAAGFIAVTTPQSRTQEYVWETLRHEVQHDSDQSRDKKADAPTDWQYKLERYKTEYRAYSYEGSDYANLDHDPANTANIHGYDWTERQYTIFSDIFDGYSHTQEGWGMSGGNPITKRAPFGGGAARQRRENRKSFQEAVVAYRNPDAEGFNKWNSVRVDDFYNSLKLVPDGTDIGDPSNLARPVLPNQQPVQDLIDVLGNLNEEDAQYILNDSPDFTGLLGTKLGGQTLAGINTMLGNV